VTRCICGCEKRAVHEHHVCYAQTVRREGGDIRDKRNLVPMAFGCHAAHHNRSRPLSAWRLPDAVFEFARELLGAGAAYEYLARRYAGSDHRLEALLQDDLRERGMRA
jgi:hypothetical protein